MGLKFGFLFGVAINLMVSAASAAIVATQPGKILHTEGHVAPSCRIVVFQDNSGAQQSFRIPSNSGGQDNGIAAVVLSALVAARPVQIFYDPAQTTGCGSEPAITFIDIF